MLLNYLKQELWLKGSAIGYCELILSLLCILLTLKNIFNVFNTMQTHVLQVL